MPTGLGPVPARIMLVQDFWTEHEERTQEALSGPHGLAFTKVLQAAGIWRSQCFVTSLIHARPPNNNPDNWVNFKNKKFPPGYLPLRDRMVHPVLRSGYNQLLREIREVQPNLIITLGNLSLWALTGALGCLKWRGSQLYWQREDGAEPGSDASDVDGPPKTASASAVKLIPLVSPTLMAYQEEARVMMAHDLRRAARHMNYEGPYDNIPKWNFSLRPSLQAALDAINHLRYLVASTPTWIDLDLETRAGHIACCGLSWSQLEAISIPFMCIERHDGYWGAEEEGEIVYALYQLLTHPNCWVRGQNLLFDCQYTYRWWHFIPNVKQDTMISHHTMFAGLPKALDFQASMYCEEYHFWKESAKSDEAPWRAPA